ncbi:TPA: hypothetical protein GX533_03250, partial [Candidatus Dojkabacteria bacterium]|nr:hypothetical protein [Candidatus Dojkabacteria bacterium]
FVTLLAEIIARTPEALDMIAGALVETKEFRGMVDNMVQDAIDLHGGNLDYQQNQQQTDLT